MARLLIPAFRYPRESAGLIGQIVVAYGSLEYDLALCVSQMIDDLDVAIKALFRTRGESQRIDIADALARGKLKPGKFRTCFEETIGHMRHCLKIRNQYAHCIWIYVPREGEGLAFVDLEEIATEHEAANPANLTRHYVSLQLLVEQTAFFGQVADSLEYLNLEYQRMAGRIPTHTVPAPPKLDRPTLHS